MNANISIVKCPQCEMGLEMEKGRNNLYLYCSYCGNKISFANENIQDNDKLCSHIDTGHSIDAAVVIYPPKVKGDYTDFDYLSVKVLFEKSGFIHIQCIPIYISRFSLIHKPQKVKEVFVNGKLVKSGSKRKCKPDNNVIIYYYSLS